MSDTFKIRSTSNPQNNTLVMTQRLLSIFCIVLLGGCGEVPRFGTQRQFAEDAPQEQPAQTATMPVALSAAKSQTPQFPVYRDPPQTDGSIVIGLDADMTSGSAVSGEAIRRGVVLAVDELNRDGGLLGRPVELVVRDHRGNPDRGIANMREFAAMRDVLAVVGGIHTPVALQELPTIHEHELIYLGPWAAGTGVVANGYAPNFVFRVSVRDEYAGGFLVRKALEKGYRRPGLLLERTGWGRSNEQAILEALQRRNLSPVAVEWLNWGEQDLTRQISRLSKAKADVILLVANPLEGVAAARAVAAIEDEKPAIISHWGISAGKFFELARPFIKDVELTFLQTYSFVKPRYPQRSQPLYEMYAARFPDCETPADIFSPVGTAHAYEIVRMLAAATRQAATLDSRTVAGELERLMDYSGVIRDYPQPFHPDHHDALTEDDFILARYNDSGVIVPVDEN